MNTKRGLCVLPTTWCGSTDSEASSVICRRFDGRPVVWATGNRKPGCSDGMVTQIALLPSETALVNGRCGGILWFSSIQFWSKLI